MWYVAPEKNRSNIYVIDSWRHDGVVETLNAESDFVLTFTYLMRRLERPSRPCD